MRRPHIERRNISIHSRGNWHGIRLIDKAILFVDETNLICTESHIDIGNRTVTMLCDDDLSLTYIVRILIKSLIIIWIKITISASCSIDPDSRRSLS